MLNTIIKKKNKTLNNQISYYPIILVIFIIPLFLYVGNRSLVAHDEGFYALQAKFILQNHQWLAPRYFNEIIFDRTAGLQWLIAICFNIFGQSVFIARLPVLIFAFICLYMTFIFAKFLNKDLQLNRSFPYLSTGILATTPVWLNYSHYAGQDIPLLACELFGLYAIVQFSKHKSHYWAFIIGPVMAMGFFIKGFMIAIPITAAFPYIVLYKRSLLKKHTFWLGLLVGGCCVFTWLGLCYHYYGMSTVSMLWSKLITLSKSSKAVWSQHPFYYYFLNIPANFFPWIFSALGGWYFLLKSKTSKVVTYFLFWYPILVIFLLSCFNTKTPYYPIQISPFIAMAAAYFLLTHYNHYKNSSIHFFSLFGIIGSCLLILTLSVYICHYYQWIILTPWHQIKLYSYLVIALSLPWFLLLFCSHQTRLALLVIGPWLALVLTVQLGLFCDRRPTLRLALSQTNIHSILSTNTVDFIAPKKANSNTEKQIIIMAFNSKRAGQIYSSINLLPIHHYAWVKPASLETNKNKIKIISTLPKQLGQWSLILKI